MLTERLLVAPQSANELVNSLVDGACVERSTNLSDGRRQVVKLMPKVERALEQLSGAHLLEIREMAPELMQAVCILQDRRKLEQISWMA
jgi:DNA-binding MarR family transcriptional regulator